jgi:phosphoglycerol transferase MdoB-like AlkP superfamily enzyme
MNKAKEFYLKYFHNALGFSVALAFVLNFAIESFSRKGIAPAFIFMNDHTLVFLYNAFIIFAILSISILFRRRVFMFSLLGTILLTGGIANFVIVSKRMTPFTVYDIMVVKEGLSIATNYLSKTQIGFLIGGLILLVVGIVFLWLKGPKKKDKINLIRNLVIYFIIITSAAGVTNLAAKANIVDTYFPNLAYGYRDNGFVYCFLNTWLNTGISKPDNYSTESIQSIFSEDDFANLVAAKGEDGSGDRPNIIFLQLESFMDPETVQGLGFSDDAIPNFRKLMENYSSGTLETPVVGAGTANVEFEVMTGMSVKFFGPGEYPHKGVLLEETCESVPYDLKQAGYSTHAIHNHRGAFYERNIVFGNLGFDTFTSLEYMNNVSKTPKNWAQDFVLTQQIMDSLNSSEGPDYIYTISVQGHGDYPTEQLLENPVITVTNAATLELKWTWEYYINQLYEMDEFVGQFIEEMEAFNEDVVVVLYGDHLPAISAISDETLSGRTMYQTDYVIWSNFSMKEEDKALTTYQLSSYVLDKIDMHQGTMVAYHQKYRDSSTYLKDMEALQYDMLYGSKYIYDGKSPFQRINMKMGVKPITVDEIIQIGDKYYLKGKNFTEYSKINLEGKILKTIYLSPTVLGLLEEVDPTSIDRMKVSQVEKNEEILSTSE